jgi:hypothetical protein
MAIKGQTKHNWPYARKIYIEGVRDERGMVRYPNLEEVGKICKIPYGYVRQRAAKQEWKAEREEYLAKLEQKRHHTKQAELLYDSVVFDNKILQIANLIIFNIKQYFLEQKRVRDEARKEGPNASVPLMSANTLEKLSRSLMTVQKISDVALGKEVPEGAESMERAADFLEKQKLMSPEEKKAFYTIAKEYYKNGGNGSK